MFGARAALCTSCTIGAYRWISSQIKIKLLTFILSPFWEYNSNKNSQSRISWTGVLLIYHSNKTSVLTSRFSKVHHLSNAHYRFLYPCLLTLCRRLTFSCDQWREHFLCLPRVRLPEKRFAFNGNKLQLDTWFQNLKHTEQQLAKQNNDTRVWDYKLSLTGVSEGRQSSGSWAPGLVSPGHIIWAPLNTNFIAPLSTCTYKNRNKVTQLLYIVHYTLYIVQEK